MAVDKLFQYSWPKVGKRTLETYFKLALGKLKETQI